MYQALFYMVYIQLKWFSQQPCEVETLNFVLQFRTLKHDENKELDQSPKVDKLWNLELKKNLSPR